MRDAEARRKAQLASARSRSASLDDEMERVDKRTIRRLSYQRGYKAAAAKHDALKFLRALVQELQDQLGAATAASLPGADTPANQDPASL